MSKVITLDLGPTFGGHAVEVAGELVCVLPPIHLAEPEVLHRISELMGSQGTDCNECRGCQVGLAQHMSS